MCRFGQNRDFRTFPQLINQCFTASAVVLHVYFITLIRCTLYIITKGAVSCRSGCTVGVSWDYSGSVGTKPDTQPDIVLQHHLQKPPSVTRHRRWWAMLCHPKIWPPFWLRLLRPLWPVNRAFGWFANDRLIRWCSFRQWYLILDVLYRRLNIGVFVTWTARYSLIWNCFSFLFRGSFEPRYII